MGYVDAGWGVINQENNCHGVMGNAEKKSGYGCEMVAMVNLWRKAWSQESDTSSLAPFGIVSLASGGSEGGTDIGGMRFSQTGNYGVKTGKALRQTLY